MSTILEALSRAERERHLGSAPALKAAVLQTASLPAAPDAGHSQRRFGLLACALVALALAAAALWWWWPSAKPQVLLGPALPATHVTDAAAPAIVHLASPTSEPAAVGRSNTEKAAGGSVASGTKRTPESRSAGKDAPGHSSGAKPVAAGPAPAVKRAGNTQASSPASSAKQVSVAQGASARTADKEAAVRPVPAADLPLLSELPPHTRSQVPELQWSGYIYSPTPRERSLLVNGRLLREGDEVLPGLRLEQMRADGVVLDYKGLRYRMAY